MYSPGVRKALAGILFCTACGAGELRMDVDRGVIMGGENVRLEGEGFLGHGPPLIHFGNTTAKSIVIESDRLIRFRTPKSETPGTIDVKISFTDGTTMDLPAAFTYEDRMPAIEIKPRS
jgi:hypothetical protein